MDGDGGEHDPAWVNLRRLKKKLPDERPPVTNEEFRNETSFRVGDELPLAICSRQANVSIGLVFNTHFFEPVQISRGLISEVVQPNRASTRLAGLPGVELSIL